jgi:hypothetical protein
LQNILQFFVFRRCQTQFHLQMPFHQFPLLLLTLACLLYRTGSN